MSRNKMDAAHQEFRTTHNVMSIEEVARYLSLEVGTIYKHEWKTKLGGVLKFRGRLYFNRETVEAYKAAELAI